MHRQAKLLQIVRTLHPATGLPGSLNGGQQESDQNTNDGDHHQQFDERKRPRMKSSMHGSCPQHRLM